MKHYLRIILLFFSLSGFSQQDTIVIHDFTKVMISVDRNDKMLPVTKLENVSQAGFFIDRASQGKIKICTTDEVYIWVDGRFFDKQKNCHIYEPEELMVLSAADTIFISFYSKKSLSGLTCELIKFDEYQVIKEDPKEPRNIRNSFQEFVLISSLLLIGFIAFVTVKHPSRINYLLGKSFTFKISSYEFVNTQFVSQASLILLSLLSLVLGFFGVYYDQLLELGYLENDLTFWELCIQWIRVSIYILGILFLKWIIVTVIARLFKFRDINHFQLFDFINFTLILCMPIFIITALDFIINVKENSWISEGFTFVFPTCLILFILWFSYKFVSNSPRRKLLIFSYLCATEIIPAIVVLGWLYK